MPPAIVVRLPTCVRFGPMIPAAVGTPLMVWQAMHGAPLNIAAPRAASPVTFWSKVRFTGSGVFGITHSGSFERGYVALDVSLSFITGPGTGAACGTGVADFLPVSAAAAGGVLPTANVFRCAM